MEATVIITNYNQSFLLKYIINSLRKQETNYKFEIIVADDGSDINNVNTNIELISSINDLDIYYIFQQDKGFRASQNRNNAIKCSRGDYIIMLDGDIVPNVDFIQKQLEVLIKEEKIITYTHRKYKFLDEIDLKETQNGDLKNLYFQEIQLKNNMKEWQRIWGYNFAFKKNKDIYFDEHFIGWGLEDVELIYRMLKSGYKAKELNNYDIFHIDNSSIGSCNPFKTNKPQDMLNFIKNAIYFCEKYNSPNDIVETFFTIPDLSDFIKKTNINKNNSSLKEGAQKINKQSIKNLYKQKSLYERYITNNKEEDYKNE